MDERVPPFRIKVGNKRSLSPWIFFIIFMVLMGILLVLFFQSPFTQIEQIEIEGNRLVSEDEIRQITQLHKGISYFHPNSIKAKKRLEELSEIEQVEVKKSFPNKLFIKIKEFPVVAFTQWDDGQFAPVLMDGTILPHRRQSDLVHAWPIIQKKDQSNATMQLALQNLAKVSENVRREIEFVDLVQDRPDQVMLTTKNNHEIFIRAKEIHQKIIYYPHFQKHPRGRLYFLQSIWFTPTSYTND